jgi:nitric-oxide synthase
MLEIPSIITNPALLTEEAMKFLEQYIEEVSPAGDMPARKDEICAEIRESGTWTPTFPELEYGARIAWRNNNRCIGRYFWKSLIVRDRRHVEDAPTIFEECQAHLKSATNNGNIRSTITIFAPQRPSEAGIRIWNYQLLGYAGWKLVTGERLGDPLNDEFTARAIAHGWQPPKEKTNFDLLPVFITDATGKLQCFELARDSVREVRIVHPEHPDLLPADLRWYAVPLLTEMSLQIGGLNFPAAPFNGFYMGTEIGARNFADENRYHLLPSIADHLQLDRSSNSTLWKDRALLELNVAVLHSFRRAGVTIIDHHTACQTFMQHIEAEEKQSRPVTGDWSWLIPPMSPATTRVFHRYYDESELTPSYHHQTRIWPEGAKTCPFSSGKE